MRAVRNLLTAALVLASPAAFAQTIAPPAGNLPFGAHQLVARKDWIIRTSWQGRDSNSGQPLVAAVQRDGLEFVIDAKPYKGKVIDVFAVTTDH